MTLGPRPSRLCQINLHQDVKEYPDLMPETPSSGSTLSTSWKTELLILSRHPAKKSHFYHLYPRSHSFGYYPKLMTIDFSFRSAHVQNRPQYQEQMSCCRSAFLIFLSALLYESCSFPLRRQGAGNFANSLRLTRNIRSRVQQLLLRYKEQQFGDSRFEDKKIALKTLPSVTINFQTWRHMEDSERLSIASRNLLTFWAHLESQCQKLELDMQNERESAAERAMQKRNKRGRPHLSLTQSMRAIQLDLRDLMRQVNFQLANILKEDPTTDYTSTPTTSATHSEEPSKPAATSSETSKATSSSPIPSMSGSHSTLGLIRTSTPLNMEAVKGRQTVPASTGEASSSGDVSQTSTTTAASRKEQPKLTAEVSQPTRWVSRLEGYVILRDLERYLSRLARDYTLLRAKY
ncbi:uncharacterized protein LOC108437023 [Pygocentrus nattereri]|uniref:uncharacterized protein LOC108437023 n=1 Tax=Pygocentrus nattereri TaxID=42514 RepID=UPI0008148AAC|nr:uncharacterized protein LOC108437023 [Pygocentrus nattereri]